MNGPGEDADPPRAWRKRISVRYAAAIFLVVGSAMIAQGLVTTWFAWTEARRLVAEIQVARVAGAADRIGHFVRDIEARLRSLVATPWLVRDDEDRRIDALRLMREVTPIAELARVDAAGREIFALSRTGADRGGGRDRSADVEVTAVRAGGIHRGGVVFRDGSEPRVRIAVAGPGADGGVAIAEIDLKLVWDIVAHIEIGRSGRAWVADDRGRLIAHPDISLVLRSTSVADLAPIARASSDADAAPVALLDPVVALDGERVLAARARIPELGWVVVAELPTREAYAPVLAGLGWTAAIVAAGLLVAVAASAMLARGMTRPIRSLRIGAQRIGAGALDHRIAIAADDELGDLGRGFNDMAARLQTSHATLESRVAERTERLRLADAAKSRFFAAANHDLRQPLHALNLFVGQLGRETDPDRRERLMDRLEAALAAMNELFDALLDVAKLDAGAIEPRFEAVAIPQLFRRLETRFLAAAEAKGLTLRLEPAAAAVRSDPLLLERILQNLVANAIRYTDDGSIRVACETCDDRLVLVVADTGIGIAPDRQALVFTEFYRVEARRDLGGGGLGLGLAIVDRLVRLLGHEIDLVSTPGRGTTFRVLAARAEASPEAPVRPAAGLPPAAFGRGRAALVVDDDPPTLDATMAHLEDWGFEVAGAASADEAWAAVAATPIDLMICDRHLGGANGLDLLVALVAAGRVRAAILVSGDTGAALAAAARDAGVPLLAKPVSPMTLRAQILALLAATAG